MQKSKGFTLIELLVVIAIIALLLSILLPALKKVKMQAKTAVCIANCKTMATAWGTYAMENDEAIVSSMTGYSDYWTELGYDPLLHPNPWTGWAGYQDDSDDNEERQTQAIEQGKLYPYLETPNVYHCPASEKIEIRCYSIPDNLGNPKNVYPYAEYMGDSKPVMKTTQVKATSSRIVFLDEGYATYGGYTIWYDKPEWWDLPPIRHDNGVTLGFMDGHSEFYKWRDERTIKTALGEPIDDPDGYNGNEDLIMMQRGIYGKLGYIPN